MLQHKKFFYGCHYQSDLPSELTKPTFGPFHQVFNSSLHPKRKIQGLMLYETRYVTCEALEFNDIISCLCEPAPALQLSLQSRLLLFTAANESYESIQ